MRKIQLPVIGGIRKTIILPSNTLTAGTTIAELGAGTVTLVQLAALLASKTNTGGGNIATGSVPTISVGPGLSGGGPIVGNVPIRLTAPIPAMLAEDGQDGEMGPPGVQGPRGPQGVPGQFLMPEDGADGDQGPPGPAGAIGTGTPGATGGVGPAGPAVYVFAEDGADGDLGPPGPPGPTGATGNVGATGGVGPASPAVFILAEDGSEGDPGIPGAPGKTGPTGGVGPANMTIFLPENEYQDDGMQSHMPTPSPNSGSFTGTLTGFTNNPSGTCFWAISGQHVALYVPVITSASSTTAMTMTGMPAAITPARTQNLSLPAFNGLENNGAATTASGVLVSTNGTLVFYNNGSTALFTNSGVKGTIAQLTLVYPLN